MGGADQKIEITLTKKLSTRNPGCQSKLNSLKVRGVNVLMELNVKL
jgi:hypothetical protein